MHRLLHRKALLHACALVLAVLTGTAAAAVPPPLVNTSHRGAIHDLAYDAPRRLLFSAGEDGTVRVWSRDRRIIVRQLRLGAVRVERIVLHPDRPLVAAYSRSTMGDAVLEVWNWQQERQLFRHDLEEAPLHLGFTSLGSSLVYSRPQFDSVVFLDPATGARQERLPPAFGIVSFVATSTNERTIMTYLPTGEVRYWDAATMAAKGTVPTLPGLEAMALSADKSQLVARSGSDVVAIDVISGAVRSRLGVSRQAQVAVAGQFAQFSVLQPHEREDRVSVLQQHALDRAFTLRAEHHLPFEGSATAATYAYRTLFFAHDGEIWEALPTGVEPFARDELVVPVALASDGDTLLVASRHRIAIAELRQSDAAPGRNLEPPAAATRLPRLSATNVLRNPFGNTVGLTALSAAVLPVPQPAEDKPPGGAPPGTDEGAVLVWNRDGASGRLGTLNPRTGRYRMRLSGLQAPLSQVSLIDDRLLLLDELGNITLYPVTDVLNATIRSAPNPEGEFWAPGTNKVVSVGAHLIAGRTSANPVTTALLKIDPTHAETLLIPDDALLIYDLAHHASGQLLTLGVEPPLHNDGRGRVSTVLRLRDGVDLAPQRTIHGLSGEDLSATLAVAPDRRRVYSSLRGDAVRVWDGVRLLEMERTNRQPRQLIVAGDLLIAHNADASFTIWDRRTRKVMFHLYLFRDFTWLVARPDGGYLHSPGAERYMATPSRG